MGAQPPGTRAATLSLLLAIAASAFWLLAPTVTSVRGSAASTAEEPARKVDRRTLLEDSGGDPRTIAALLLPVAPAGVALALNRTRFRAPARTVAAALLLIGAILTGFSVGLAYMPSAISMLAAACMSGDEVRVTAPPPG
jgi:hypothetical protein